MRAAVLCLALVACAADPIAGSDGGPSAVDAATPPRIDANLRRDFPPGAPGCGLAAAAFCDTFDDVAASGLGEGRVGELDPQRWSGARTKPGLNGAGLAVPVPLATTGPCRDDLPAQVYPGQDALVCDGTDAIHSRHLLTTSAEQSYGQLSLRARQPFDFSGREGTIVFDVDADGSQMLEGWVAIAITEDPSPAPSFGTRDNFENGASPRNGIEVHFYQLCGGEHRVGVGQVSVFEDWVERDYPAGNTCVTTRDGALDHFEIRISQSHLEVWASEPSTDGVTFPDAQRLYALDVDLPFERGYVHYSTHNHSSLKYSYNEVDSFVARWDNLGFDGPVIDDWREYSIADSMIPIRTDITAHPISLTLDCQNVGYLIDETPTSFAFSGVDVADVATAQVALDLQVLTIGASGFDAYDLRYRLNGGAWQDYRFPAGQLTLVAAPIVIDTSTGQQLPRAPSPGTVSVLLDVDPAGLVAGQNTIELATQNVPLSYPPYVVNLDLVLRTH